jgi:hypothetical protein
VKWKIYYSDHTKEHDTSVSSENATPFSITRRADVQVIIQGDPDHKWVTRSGFDFYVWDQRGGRAEWFEADHFGLDHYLLQPGYRCVLFGTRIDTKRFNEIFNLARQEWGDKTAFAKHERKP